MSLFKKSKKLYRSREDRIVAGICGGIADYLEMDSTLIRIIFILLLFAVGSSIIIYLILIFVMPLEPRKEVSGIKKEETKEVEKIKK